MTRQLTQKQKTKQRKRAYRAYWKQFIEDQHLSKNETWEMLRHTRNTCALLRWFQENKGMLSFHTFAQEA